MRSQFTGSDKSIAARQAKQRRLEVAQILQARGQTGLTAASETTLGEAEKCHARALHHQRAAAKHYEISREHIDELRTVHRKISTTLSGLGFGNHAELRGHLDSLADHVKGARQSHESAADHVTNVGAAVRRAARCVRSVLTGAKKPPPAEDLDEDDE